MNSIGLKQVQIGGVSLYIPEIWASTTEIYTHIDVQFIREEILTKHPRNK